jgi:hypothetical protein
MSLYQSTADDRMETEPNVLEILPTLSLEVEDSVWSAFFLMTLGVTEITNTWKLGEGKDKDRRKKKAGDHLGFILLVYPLF